MEQPVYNRKWKLIAFLIVLAVYLTVGWIGVAVGASYVSPDASTLDYILKASLSLLQIVLLGLAFLFSILQKRRWALVFSLLYAASVPAVEGLLHQFAFASAARIVMLLVNFVPAVLLILYVTSTERKQNTILWVILYAAFLALTALGTLARYFFGSGIELNELLVILPFIFMGMLNGLPEYAVWIVGFLPLKEAASSG